VATFSDLSISVTGSGYTLTATSGALSSAVSAAFAITPAPSLHITTSTTGAGMPSGYSLCVDHYRSPSDRGGGCRWSGTIGVNGAVSLPWSGTHTVALNNVPYDNCWITGDTINPRTVSVSGTTEVPFSVACRDTGSVQVTVTITGTGVILSGYTVCVDRVSNPCFWNTPVPPDPVTISGVTAEAHTVTLHGVVPANCSVSGGTSQTITVPAHGVADVTYEFTCVATGTAGIDGSKVGTATLGDRPAGKPYP